MILRRLTLKCSISSKINRAMPVFHVYSSSIFLCHWQMQLVSSLRDAGKTALSTLKGNINNFMAYVKSEDSTMTGLQDERLEAAIWCVCFPYDKIIKNATINDLRRAAYQCFVFISENMWVTRFLICVLPWKMIRLY